MKTTVLALLLLVNAAAISAVAEGPTLVLDPSTATLPTASSQVFTVSFSDGSHVKGCVWAATGDPPNSMVSLGSNNVVAAFGAGTTPGQYVVTAVCSNAQGVTVIGSAPVIVVPQQ